MGNVCSPKAVAHTLENYGVAPLKRLGQNFLIDENVVEKIAEAAAGENVLEIGPGLGALTCALAKRAKKVVAVEIDPGMVRVLRDTLYGLDNVTVLHQDILETDIKALAKAHFDGRFAVAGNLPYYITAKCILQVLDAEAPLDKFTVMVQREVADRLAAKEGQRDYGALTASVAYYGGMRMLFGVGAGCFYPRPEVESAVVQMFPERQFDVSRKNYTRAVRMLFAMRRKTVRNNLKSGMGISAEMAAQILQGAGIDPGARAETLPAAAFAELAAYLER